LKVFRSHLKVRSYELDSFGHANHAVFLNYLEQARFEALASAGFSYGAIQARGWAIHVVRAEIDYLAELKLDDALEIETWISGYRRTSMMLSQRIFRSREGQAEAVLASRSIVVGVWIGENGRPMRVPPGVKDGMGTPPST
jgi:acyl-CoA thioester hydrolase